MAGGPYPGFQRSQGLLAWAGYSQRLSDSSYAGAQFSRATGVPTTLMSLAPATANVDSWAAGVGTGGEITALGRYTGRLVFVSRLSVAIPARAEVAGLF